MRVLSSVYAPPVAIIALLGVWSAITLLLVGLFLPVIELQKFWIFHNSVSLWGGIQALVREGEVFLGLVIAVFAIVFPLAKLGVMLGLLHDLKPLRGNAQQALYWLSVLGKWSMLDVFIVAILVTTLKLGGIANAHTGPGLYCFLASVVLAQLLGFVLGHARAGSA